MKTLLRPLCVALVGAALTSCGITLNEDGSKSATVDAEQAAKLIKIIAEK